MSNQVLYRKWRPQRFESLVGQEPIARTLRQAVARGRIAHAYLFCGPRGTGKTSTARILAKAVNCLNPLEGEPCNECRFCVAVNEGRALDLVEVDAASNRGIDEIRNIREKVHYSPTESRYKVYVLDEAHMLTDAAADALLKTLEEPPAHVIFVMATTDPQKLAATIVSRCQRYDFRRVDLSAMAQMLGQICQAEGIQADEAALHGIARNADGSMRDAESLLEQAITSFGSPLTLEQVQLLLGLTSADRVRALVRHLLLGQTPAALTALSAIAAEGLNLRQLHRQMVDEVRDLVLIKTGAQQLVAQPQEVIREQAELAGKATLERLLSVWRLLGQVTFRNDAPPTLALELAVIEGSQQVGAAVQVQGLATPAGVEGSVMMPPVQDAVPPRQERRPAPPSPRQTPPGVQAEPPPRARQQRPSAQPPGERPDASANTEGMSPPERLHHFWDDIIRALDRYKWRRFKVGSLLRSCKEFRLEEDTLYLTFSHQSHIDRMREELDQPEGRKQFMEILTRATGVQGQLKVEFVAPNGAQRNAGSVRSPLVQAALGMGGRIIHESEESDE